MFFGLFSLPQNLKMASCKGYRVSEKPKKAKKNVVIADFSKIKTPLKALYVRLKGIPEGGGEIGTENHPHDISAKII